MAAPQHPRIAQYHLLGRIGSGGMGDVWLARVAGPAGFEKLVALKTIKGSESANDPLTKMFLLEARVAALLAHPNCVQVFELGEDAGTYFIAMEYIDGFSLARVLRRAVERDLWLPIPVVARILVDAAAGLEYAHALKDTSGQPLGLVHRDVSLENVLVTFGGQTKLVDFGIAKLNALTGERTETGTVKGKYAYMAPEYLRGEPIDGRADVFALGVVGYRALGREKPFSGESDAQVIAQLLAPAPAPPVSNMRAHVSPELDAVIAKALAKDPAQRFDSARALRTAVIAAVPDLADPQDVAALMATLWAETDPDREIVRRFATAAVEAQTTPLSAPARLSTSAETTPAAKMTTVDGPLPRPKRQRRWIVGGVLAAACGAGAAIFVATRGGSPAPVAPAPPAVAAAASDARAVDAAPAIDRQRVAVLPFVISESSPAPDFIAGGLRDALSGKLGGLDRVTVAAAKATDAAAKQPPAKLGRQLGVATIVTGTVAMQHDRLEVDISVVDAASEKQTFTHHYSGALGDLFTVDDSIARDVVAAIGVTTSADETAHLTAHPTDKADAYELYLQAKRKATDLDDKKMQEAALALYEQAIARDPNFALAYAGMAESQMRLYVATRTPIWETRARSAAEQAVRLDDKLAEVHNALGFVDKTTGRTSDAIAEYKIAARLAPSSDEAYRHLGNVYMSSGKLPESIAAFEHAIELNPYYWGNYGAAGLAYQTVGDLDRSIERSKKAIELAPDSAVSYNTLATAYSMSGKIPLAVETMEKALAIKQTPELYANLGVAYANLGRFADAQAVTEKAVALSPDDAVYTGALADTHLWAGASDAKALYAKAIKMGLENLAVTPRDAFLLAELAAWYAKSGNSAKARKMMASALAINHVDVVVRYDEVIMLAYDHQIDAAFKSLDAALAGGYTAAFVATDPDMQPLRGDPRFAPLLAKYRTPKR